MLRKRGDQKTEIRENMRGGAGTVLSAALLAEDEMYGKGRLCSKLTVKPGCSIGFHVHENEMEAFYVIKGKGEFDDNGELKPVAAGDLLYTPDGTGHAVRNTGEAGDLELLALILYH